MTTRSQTGSLKPKYPTSYLAMSTNVIEPSCYSQATKYAHWCREMQEEYNSLIQNGTWQLVPPSQSQNIIGSKLIFKTKVKPNGSVDRYKARLIAKGYHQRPCVDYVDTFSIVVKPATIRLLLSLAISNNWHITQLDISNVFLHGTLDELVYMSQPPGFVDPDRPKHVCLLKRSFYVAIIFQHLLHLPLKLSSFEGSHFHDEILYRSTVGAPQYLTLTRPDIAFAVNKVSQFTHSSKESHWAAVKCILRYIQSISSHGLFFARQNTKFLHGYSDADWGGLLDDRKFTIGFAVYLGSHLISWAFKKQRAVARSSIEAEYRTLATAASELTGIFTS
ncbi:hypothetical protein MTR67_035517 [Solanum verrucosum]|uniref:Reverse transcriptase Ty1/copia-type domain-containing protein n=1 Tax=Solanum verrucosum TaxID=315347 RepID=A0AAF0UA19_SOLVR|nr:hypothetical protein MTR67_035517 [Solanum verrucosum]